MREIKCPHCGEWTMWRGLVDDRCLYCNGFLEPQRFPREVEEKLKRELLEENDFFFIKPDDSKFTRIIKKALNATRWTLYYMQMAFFVFISILLVLLSLLAG